MENSPEYIAESDQPGVLGHRIEYAHMIVTVRWKDGSVTERHFPSEGFGIYKPGSRDRIGFLKAEEALKILEDHAAEYDSDEFEWGKFVQ